METEVESMVTVPIQQVSSSVPLLILQSSISHLLNQYLLPVKNHSLQLSPPTSALQQSSSVLEMYYNLPPRTVSPDPVAIVASRAVDPVGSPSSTTIDQDEQSTSTSPTNQEIQSQVTHQGPVPQLMAPDHSSSGPVLHEMTSDQEWTIPKLISRTRRTGKKKLCKADLEDVDSEHFDRDDNTGDDNEETKPDPEEIYK
ncbi:hypothetical protein Tco_0892630 [Tanacetum coccineum]|uniref:Uncharacterized protein n=1 Tax=Tanacetum coccineum TaxID=301880 RepID=A0ABQ5C9M3_9ASTR